MLLTKYISFQLDFLIIYQELIVETQCDWLKTFCTHEIDNALLCT